MDDPAAELARLAATPTDPAARDRARQLCAAGLVVTAVDRHGAAIVLGASDLTADVARAYDLALSSMGGYRPARRLAAQLYDRLRVLEGRQQKFGTQRGPDGSAWSVDPATTDSERAKWDLPPLSELQRGDVDLNRQ